jgi:peptidyl-tRNA hydrolase, PTH1 family
MTARSILGRFRAGGRTSPVEWLIAGLGNPGARYARTRHNVGRAVIAVVASAHGVAVDQLKHHARFGTGTVAGRRVCLVAPTTYMNESGVAVVPLARFYRVTPDRILLVSDDLDLPLGRLRLRERGGAGGHNGIASVLRLLGTEDVPRLRVGIGRPPDGWDPADYVLTPFAAAEVAVVEDTVTRAAAAIEAVLASGLPAAMNVYN